MNLTIMAKEIAKNSIKKEIEKISDDLKIYFRESEDYKVINRAELYVPGQRFYNLKETEEFMEKVNAAAQLLEEFNAKYVGVEIKQESLFN